MTNLSTKLNTEATKLTYSVGPNIVYCTREGSESIVSLIISASNTGDDAVEIASLTVTVPRGDGANQLTTSAMAPISLQESWRFKTQGDDFRATPVTGTGLDAGQSVTFMLRDVKVNMTAGTAVVEIREASGDDFNSVFIPITKIKSSLNIDAFSAVPVQVKSGDAATLSWKTTAAAGVTLTPGSYPSLKVNDSITVNPELTTTYTLTANGEGPNISKQVTITVPPPKIEIFEPAQHEINAGEKVRISWKVTNADSVTLNPYHEHDALPLEGFIEVVPDATTTYILTARNKALQTVDKHETVKIKPVSIKKFTATPAGGLVPGDSVTLEWATESATQVYILPDGAPVAKSGTIKLNVRKDTSYTLVASNSSSSASAAATASLLAPGWKVVINNSPLPRETEYPCITYNHAGRMWLLNIDDFTGSGLFSSADGRNWNKAGAQLPGNNRGNMATATFGGKAWMFGGNEKDRFFNEVWSSADGAQWAKVATAPWKSRAGAAAFVLGQRMYIVGGVGERLEKYNDVWSTTDGVNWQKETDNAFKGPRWDIETVVYNGMAWAIGGLNPDNVFIYEVYTSTDGKTWQLQTAPLPWQLDTHVVTGRYSACATKEGIFFAICDQRGAFLQNLYFMNSYGTWSKIPMGDDMKKIAPYLLEFNGTAWGIGGRMEWKANPNVMAFIPY